METKPKPDRPHRDRGARFRARRRELQSSGVLTSDLSKLAERAGVSISGFQQWERGETWPRDKKKAALAELLGWTEVELDHGPQETEPWKGSEMAFHPVGPREMEVLSLYRALATNKLLESQVVDYLKAKVGSLHVMQREVRGEVQIMSDQQIENAGIPAAPDAKPRRTKTR